MPPVNVLLINFPPPGAARYSVADKPQWKLLPSMQCSVWEKALGGGPAGAGRSCLGWALHMAAYGGPAVDHPNVMQIGGHTLHSWFLYGESTVKDR